MIGASHIYRKIAKSYLTDPLPESYNLPFSMYDESEIKRMLQNSGFSKFSVEKVNKLSVSPTAKDATDGLTQAGVFYNEIMKRNPLWIEEIKILVEKELAEKYGAASIVTSMSALIS